MRKSKLTLSDRSVPVIFLLVTILAFGLLIPWLGFYWDDWAKILVSRLYGLSGYFAYYAEDRPLSAWTHIVFTPIVGQGPLGWQILALLLRWLSGWGMWWSLKKLWPQSPRQNFTAAILFLIYPVFAQQAAAVTFHQQWLQFALFFVSIGAMIRAWRLPQRRSWRFAGFSALSVITMLLQLSVTEYFAPLELIRPVVLWILFSPLGDSMAGFTRTQLRNRVWLIFRAWAPFLGALAVYSIWRLFLIQLPGEDPYRANTLFELFTNPLATLVKYAGVIAVDEAHILLNSWTDLLKLNLSTITPMNLMSMLVGLTAGGITAGCLLLFDRYVWNPRLVEEQGTAVEGNQRQWMRQIIFLGIIAVLLGPVPAWLTGRQVVFDFHSDRYALPAMFGAALLTLALVEWLAKPRAPRAFLVGLLVMLAVGYHFRVANDYRWIWKDQQRVFWQLYWRAPSLKPGTAVFFENEPFPNQGLFSTSSALNLLYPQEKAADPGQLNLDYWVYTLRPRYSHAPESPVIGLSTRFRTLKFKGETPNSLLIYKDSPKTSCIWVLSETDENNSAIPYLMQDFLSIANLEQISSNPARDPYPPETLFGAEPEHGWCYYFQKASLAVQLKDWEQASRLADEVIDQGFLPTTPGSNTAYEWQPFIEGLANAGRWEEAALLTQMVYQRDSQSAPMYCALWQNGLSSDQGTAESIPYIQDVKTELGCSGGTTLEK